MNPTKQELKFMKTYFKPNYAKEQNLVSNEFDIDLRQAPKKIFVKVNQEKGTDHKYSFKKHLDRMYSMLPKDKVKELIPRVDEANQCRETISASC